MCQIWNVMNSLTKCHRRSINCRICFNAFNEILKNTLFLSCTKTSPIPIIYIHFLFKVQKEGLRGEKVSEILFEDNKLGVNYSFIPLFFFYMYILLPSVKCSICLIFLISWFRNWYYNNKLYSCIWSTLGRSRTTWASRTCRLPGASCKSLKYIFGFAFFFYI